MEQPTAFPTAPQDVRREIRQGRWARPTAGLAPGYVQANLIVLPRLWAHDFLLFAQRNPKPCPVLEVTDPGSAEPRLTAPGADLRTDLPKYHVWRCGELEAESPEVTALWRDDLVAFLLGCSFTFESALLAAGLPVRHLEEDCNVPMYITSIECVPGGPFRGPMVVTMRPMPHALVPRAVLVTARYPAVHGAPVHIGDPAVIGISDLSRPDFGDPVTLRAGETPVFWACGVTSQAVARRARPELMITHAPGHMFVTDLRDEHVAAS